MRLVIQNLQRKSQKNLWCYSHWRPRFHLKYDAHVTRMQNSALQKQLLFCEAPQPRRGGPLPIWTKLKKSTGIETEQLLKTMYNRKDFNKWITQRYSRPAKFVKTSQHWTNRSIDADQMEPCTNYDDQDHSKDLAQCGVEKAVEHGYQVLRVHEVWHFPEISPTVCRLYL